MLLRDSVVLNPALVGSGFTGRAIHELTVAVGALTDDSDAGAAGAVASAALADQLAREEFGSTTNSGLIASIIRVRSRDVSRVVGAESMQP